MPYLRGPILFLEGEVTLRLRSGQAPQCDPKGHSEGSGEPRTDCGVYTERIRFAQCRLRECARNDITGACAVYFHGNSWTGDQPVSFPHERTGIKRRSGPWRWRLC